MQICAESVPRGIDLDASRRFPDRFEPAMIPENIQRSVFPVPGSLAFGGLSVFLEIWMKTDGPVGFWIRISTRLTMIGCHKQIYCLIMTESPRLTSVSLDSLGKLGSFSVVDRSEGSEHFGNSENLMKIGKFLEC